MFRRMCLFIMVIAWMGLIFSLSSQNAKESSQLSGGMIIKVLNSVPVLRELPYEQKEEIRNMIHFVVRKTAHFTLYMVLGILVYLLCDDFRFRHSFITAVLICLIYAVSDEIHQLFSAGRSAEVRDVIIDTFGASVGGTLVILLKKLTKNIRLRQKFHKYFTN